MVMKITVEDFEKIVNSSHFLHLTLNLISCALTCDAENSKHKSQNSLDDNLCKSDVEVDIYIKLLLIKSNPVVFLLIPKD